MSDALWTIGRAIVYGAVLGTVWALTEAVWRAWLYHRDHEHEWLIYHLEPTCRICKTCSETYCEEGES